MVLNQREVAMERRLDRLSRRIDLDAGIQNLMPAAEILYKFCRFCILAKRINEIIWTFEDGRCAGETRLRPQGCGNAVAGRQTGAGEGLVDMLLFLPPRA